MVRARKRCVGTGSSGIFKVDTVHQGSDLTSQPRKDPKILKNPKSSKEFQGKLSHSSPPITRSCSSTYVTERNTGTGTDTGTGVQQMANVCFGGVTISSITVTQQVSELDDEVQIIGEISRQSRNEDDTLLSSCRVGLLSNKGMPTETKPHVLPKEEASSYTYETISAMSHLKSELNMHSLKTENSLGETVFIPLPEGLDKVESEIEVTTSNDAWESVESTEQLTCQTPHKIQICNEEVTQSPSTTLSSLGALRINQTPKKAARCSRKLHPSQVSNRQVTHKSPRARQTEIIKQVAAKNHKIDEYYPIIRRSNRKTKRIIVEEKQLELEQAIKEKCEDGLEVHNFESKGRGVVTTRSFSKGEFVVEYSGELIDLGEAKQRENVYTQDQNTGCYMYYFKYKNNQYCIDATSESGRLGRLVNHSRTNGNLVTKTVAVGNKPHLVLLAKEDIPAGEEIMYDYGDRSKESLRHHPWLNC